MESRIAPSDTGNRQPPTVNRMAPASGAYALILRNEGVLELEPGKLGRITLSAGWYIYAGRASRGLAARLARHRRRCKTPFWHIDHLTCDPKVILEEILVIPQKPHLECGIIRACLEKPGIRSAIPRFGAGDCREKCPSHLLFLPSRQVAPVAGLTKRLI